MMPVDHLKHSTWFSLLLAPVLGPHIQGRPAIEMSRNRDRSFCCGGGGGHLWMELDVEAERLNQLRFRQALDVGAETIGTACPYCVTMLEDAGKVLDREDVAVRDFVELLAEALDDNLDL